jgi:3-oxoadipate enol-lactonase
MDNRAIFLHHASAFILFAEPTDLVPLLPSLGKIPTVVVHGRRDPARTLAHAEELAGGIPNASLVVRETGHTSCAEAPREFAGVVSEIIDSI